MVKKKQNTGEALLDQVYQQFIQSVVEHPEKVEDTGRIMADWLEDHDEPALAAWHRRPLAGIAPRAAPRTRPICAGFALYSMAGRRSF